MDIGWFVWVKMKELIINNIIIIWLISENSLIKILILEIKDNFKNFFWYFKKLNFIFDLQDQCFY